MDPIGGNKENKCIIVVSAVTRLLLDTTVSTEVLSAGLSGKALFHVCLLLQNPSGHLLHLVTGCVQNNKTRGVAESIEACVLKHGLAPTSEMLN